MPKLSEGNLGSVGVSNNVRMGFRYHGDVLNDRTDVQRTSAVAGSTDSVQNCI